MAEIRARFFLTGTVLVLVGAMGACGDRTAVVRCGAEHLGVDDILTEAGRPVYDELRDEPEDLIDAVIRNRVVRHALTAEALTPKERLRLTAVNRMRDQEACVTLGIKRRLASGDGLDTVARERFEADPTAFTLPESFRLQMIFLPAETPDAEGLALRLLEEIRANPDHFGDLARRHSQSKTSDGGGFTRPMPGSAVHPAMRAAILKHQASSEPFTLSIDRGWYVLRILDFWPPVEGDYEQVAPTVRKKVVAQLLDEEFREISRAVAGQHTIVVDDAVFLDPEVGPERTVMTIDGIAVTSRQIFPGMAEKDTIAGPILQREAEAFRRNREGVLFFQCPEGAPVEITTAQIAALRMGDALDAVALRKMAAELEEYVEIHRSVLNTEPLWNFDLWIFPRKSDDPYRDLQDDAALVEALAEGTPPGVEALEEAGVLFFPGLSLNEGRILQYDPRVVEALKKLGDDETSSALRSTRLHAFLVVRRHGTDQGRLLKLDDPDDRQVIVRQFVAANRDEVMDAFFEEAVSNCRINNTLVAQCVSRVAFGVTEGGAR